MVNVTDLLVRFYAIAVVITMVSIGADAQVDATKLDFKVGMFGKGRAIVYGRDDDGLPSEMLVKGTIVGSSISGTICGTTGGTASTLKLKLSEKPETYKQDFLYVIVMCLAGEENENLIGKEMRIRVRKLTKYPFKSVVRLASLDSGGTPFYLSTVEGIGDQFQSLIIN